MFETKIITNEPAFRPRPADLPGYHRFSNGEFDAFVHKDNVLNTIAAGAWERHDREIAGRLAGRPFRDERGHWVVISDAILALTESTATAVRTTVQDAADLSLALEQDYPSYDLLGWYHSHICPLHEYSSTDRANQAEWTKPYHLGLLVVVGSRLATVHAFRGPEGERLAEPYVYRSSESLALNESQMSRTPTMPVPARSYEAAPSTSRISLLANLIHLMLWPFLFLVGIHILAEGIAQVCLPIIIQQTDDWKPIAESVNNTANEIESLKTEFEQQMSQTEQEIREIRAYHERNQEGMDMLNWVADQLSIINTKSASEIDLDNQ